MKRTLMIFMAAVLLTLPGNSQLWRLRRLEVTAAAGTTHSFTDIGRYSGESSYLGVRNIAKVNTGLAMSASIRYRFTSDLAARLSLTNGFLRASDIHGEDPARGYEALIEFFEPSLIGEFYVIKNKREDALLFIKSRREGYYPLMAYFDMNVFAGIAGVKWDVTPDPSLALHITDTKGFTPAIPLGVGFARTFPNNFKSGIELGGRYLLGDNLDALSLRGTGNDAYYFLNVNFTWRIRTKKYPSY
jgi:hypothetical protein